MAAAKARLARPTLCAVYRFENARLFLLAAAGKLDSMSASRCFRLNGRADASASSSSATVSAGGGGPPAGAFGKKPPLFFSPNRFLKYAFLPLLGTTPTHP